MAVNKPNKQVPGPLLEDYVNKAEDSQAKIWELFRYYRSEAQYEHGVLTGRVTWLITCQSFLVAAYTVSYTRLGQPNWFSNQALPLLAFVLSLLAFFMIKGATDTIDMWWELRRDLVAVAALSPPGLDPILIRRWRSGKHHDDFIHTSSLLFPRLIPFVFMIFWVVVARLSYLLPWISVQGSVR